MAENARDALNTHAGLVEHREAPDVHAPKDPARPGAGEGCVYVGRERRHQPTSPASPRCAWNSALLTVRGHDAGAGVAGRDIHAERVRSQRMAQRDGEQSYPSMLYLEPTQPVATLHVWPIPQHAYTLQLLPWMAHSPYGGWDDVLEWPSGYQRAITYNLALELAPQYGVEPSPMIVRTAEESKRALYPINAEVGRLSLWPGRPVGGSPLGLPRGFLEGDALICP